MYLVVEMQKTGNSLATICNDYVDRNEAESRYHAALSAAAISSVPLHTVVLLNDEGTKLDSKYYPHAEEGD